MKQPKRVHYKTMAKKLHLSNKSMKLDIIEWIAIFSKEGLTCAAKYKNCVSIHDHDPLNLNPGIHFSIYTVYLHGNVLPWKTFFEKSVMIRGTDYV